MDFHRSSQQSRPPAQSFSTTSNDEFPSLGGGSGAPVMQHGLHFPKRGQGPGRGPLREEDFPALGPDTGPTASVSLRVNSVSTADRAKGVKPTNVSIHVNHRPSGMTATVSSSKNPRPQSREAFPSLLNSYSTISSKTTPQTTPAPAPQWSAKESETKSAVKTKPAAASVRKPAQLKSYKSSHFDDDDYPMRNDFPALGNNLPSHIASLASSQWSSNREPESKFSTNKNKPSQPPPKPSQPKTYHIEDDFPSLNSRFDASCSFSPEPKRVEPKPPEKNKKKESSISIAVDNNWVKGTSPENVSSDSDVGSKKSNKKKKKKSKQKNEVSSSESSQNVSIKTVNNNNDSGKKNKQKEEPKSKVKQIKVEEKHSKTKPNEEKSTKKSSKSQEIERKRSELTIDSLNDETSSENCINMNDFPSLSNRRLPPGFVREKTPAPPGFEAPSNPPPGFSITLNSVARPTNGLTFTSSSGQNYPIPSGNPFCV